MNPKGLMVAFLMMRTKAHLQERIVNDITDMQDSMDKVNNKMVNRMVSKLFEQAHNGLYVNLANLDSTTFGKHGGTVVPPRIRMPWAQRGVTRRQQVPERRCNTTETPWYRLPLRRVDECPICLATIYAWNAAMRCVGDAGRHHYFHSRCLQQWLQNVRGARCPTCRGDLQINAHHVRRWLNRRNVAGLNQQERSVLASNLYLHLEDEFVWTEPAGAAQGADDFTEWTFIIPRLIHRVVCIIAFMLFFYIPQGPTTSSHKANSTLKLSTFFP
eukprot:gnl/MRDRNA2_/MRDRNA2_65111_c0_seq1.p1 gnl/MRDRNA2_/MRDRNA2_65111_c0~~gnl/MRDRNA2_/MRDRNA2_65111_c0_seq1.p1  ORF type:complete len:303 (-),score=24.71 gnl/MRDRNA2_/MRDRNA2_65111_c0_seq1:436-1251(-)